jgi:hypothetical protein
MLVTPHVRLPLPICRSDGKLLVFSISCKNSISLSDWPAVCFVVRVHRERDQVVLRISIEDGKTTATLKVEGKVVGPWAAELGRAWPNLWASTQQKELRLDIREATFVDRKGIQVLREIVRATGAEVLADSPLTQYFASQAKCDPAPEPTEES